MTGNSINDYHIHIYYEQNTLELAKQLGAKVAQIYNLPLGHFHTKNVGPHPRWSVQLTVPIHLFADVIGWFCLHRQGLTLFIHPNTGQDLQDHRDRAIWMGESLDLNLEIFQ
jgi:DOPA 4,5-dioxygenase